MKLRYFEEKFVSYHWTEILRFRRHALLKYERLKYEEGSFYKNDDLENVVN